MVVQEVRVMKVVTAGLLLLAVTSAHAEQGAAYLGEAQATCGEFLRAADTERATPEPTGKVTSSYYAYINLADGFLTGMNVAEWTRGVYSVAGYGTDALSRMAWIENYCRANPMV